MKIEGMYFKDLATTEADCDLKHEKEINLVRKLRYKLERELVKKASTTHSPWTRKLKKFWLEVGHRVRAAGPYEENDYYYEYFLLDLMYKASFHQLSDPVACFEEMTGAVQCILNWSHES